MTPHLTSTEGNNSPIVGDKFTGDSCVVTNPLRSTHEELDYTRGHDPRQACRPQVAVTGLDSAMAMGKDTMGKDTMGKGMPAWSVTSLKIVAATCGM